MFLLLLATAWWITAAAFRQFEGPGDDLSVVVTIEGEAGLRCATSISAELRGNSEDVTAELERVLRAAQGSPAEDPQQDCEATPGP